MPIQKLIRKNGQFVLYYGQISDSQAAPNPVVTADFSMTPNYLAVSFDASATVNANTYTWNFGDGVSGAGVTTSHTYTTAGTYTIQLTATNGTSSDSISKSITVSSQPAPSDPDAARRALPQDGSYEPFAQLSYDTVGVYGTPVRTVPIAQRTAGLLPSTMTAGESSLTAHTGDITYSDASTATKTIQNTKFVGKVSITGINYLFKNCLFLGAANNGPTVQCTNDAQRGAVFEDCEFRGLNTSNNDYTDSDGIYGHDFTTIRCWIHGVVDGVHPNPRATDGVVNWHDYGSVINAHSFYSPWHWQSNNASHNDCIQINGGHGIYLKGTKLEGFYDTSIGQATIDNSSKTGTGNFYYPYMQSTSNLMGTPLNVNFASGNYHFDYCWFDGGAYGFNWASNTPAYDQDIYYDHCVFGTHQRVNNARVMVTPSLQPRVHMTNNTLRDGTPANTFGNS